MIKIRRYGNSDKVLVEPMFEDFEDYLASVDNIRRLTRKAGLKKAGYGKLYLKETLKKIGKQNGAFYLAEDNGKIVGFVVAWILKTSKISRIEVKRTKLLGEIAELYIDPHYRWQGLGKKLMKVAESYLKKKKCTDLILWVFSPNVNARSFYKKLGYMDRNIHMIKEI